MPFEDSTQMDAQPRVILQPIAAPSILGLYGLAGATFIVAAQMAHWFGSSDTTLLLVPFAAIFGGLAQFLAGMWAYKARDGVATEERLCRAARSRCRAASGRTAPEAGR